MSRIGALVTAIGLALEASAQEKDARADNGKSVVSKHFCFQEDSAEEGCSNKKNTNNKGTYKDPEPLNDTLLYRRERNPKVVLVVLDESSSKVCLYPDDKESSSLDCTEVRDNDHVIFKKTYDALKR